jgi:hypothetical protein
LKNLTKESKKVSRKFPLCCVNKSITLRACNHLSTMMRVEKKNEDLSRENKLFCCVVVVILKLNPEILRQ